MEYRYRLVVGEKGNETGHILSCKAKTIEGSVRSLKKAMRPYKGHGWGRVEYTCPEMEGWGWVWKIIE